MPTRTEKLVVTFEGDARGIQAAAKSVANALKDLEGKAGKSTKTILGGFSGLNVGFNALVQNVKFAAGIIGKAVDQINQVDAMAKTAKAAGLSAEAYQELAHAANLAGLEHGAFDSAAIKLNVSLGKAAQGSKRQVDALNALGVTSTDTNVALGQIADGLATIENPAERARLAVVLFGEAGPRMVEMLGQGSAALDEMRSSASKLTDEQVRQAEELNDKYDMLAETLSTKYKSAVIDAASAVQYLALETRNWLASIGATEMSTLGEAAARVEALQVQINQAREAAQRYAAEGDSVAAAAVSKRADKLQSEIEVIQSISRNKERADYSDFMSDLQDAEGRRADARARKQGPKAFAEKGGAKSEAKAEAKARKSELEAQEAINKRIFENELERKRGEAERNREVFESEQRIGEARMAEVEAIQTQQEKIREFSQSVSANLSDMAVQGSSAADQLKRKVVQALLQASIQAFSSMGGGGPNWGKIGLSALGTILGVADLGSGAAASGNFDAASGGTYTPQGPVQFASAGSGEVRGPGVGDRPVTISASPGEIINVTRPRGTGGMGGAKVEQNVSVNVTNNHGGAEIRTEARRGPNGEQQIQVIVDRAIAKSAATRRGGANALLDDSGSRRAPRPGID